MKTTLGFLAALFVFALSALPVEAQTRTIRHPTTGSPALTVMIPGGWSSSVDPDNNLILTSPTTTTAFSLSLVPNDPGYTLDRFAREALSVAKAEGVTPSGEEMIPPYNGSRYTATMPMNGMALNLKMVIVGVEGDKVASATMISRPTTSAEDLAVAEMVLKTIRVVR